MDGETETMAKTLASYLNAIIDEGAENDAEIIEKAMATVPRDVIDQHIRTLIRAALAGVWHQRRRANGIITGPAAEGREHPGVTAETGKRAKNRGGVHSGRSPKVAAIRAAVADGRLQAWYRDELYTGTQKIRLGQATFADLMAVSQYYRGLASANLRVAERVEKIAATLQEHNVDRVSDLPQEVALALADA